MIRYEPLGNYLRIMKNQTTLIVA